MGISALSELFVYIPYLVLGVVCIKLFKHARKSSGQKRTIAGIAVLLCILMMFGYKSCLHNLERKGQLDQVGRYCLTDYPNCESCVLELKEDLTYQVLDKERIIEQSDWHIEAGGDYFIISLDNNSQQLGGGYYTYKRYELKY